MLRLFIHPKMLRCQVLQCCPIPRRRLGVLQNCHMHVTHNILTRLGVMSLELIPDSYYSTSTFPSLPVYKTAGCQSQGKHVAKV